MRQLLPFAAAAKKKKKNALYPYLDSYPIEVGGWVGGGRGTNKVLLLWL